MAVTLVREVYDGRDLGRRGPGGREYRRAFVVETDSGLTTAFDVQAADVGGVAVPQWGNPLLEDGLPTGLVVTGISIKAHRSHLHWRVEVTYSADVGAASAVGGGGASSGAGHGEGGLGAVGGGGGGGQSGGGNVPGGGEGGGGVAGNGTPAANPQPLDNPLLRPVQAQYRTIKRSVVMKRQNGAPLTNSAEDIFDPPPDREKPYLQLVITHNTATFSRTLIELYVGAINDRAFLGFDEKTVMLTDLQATLRFEHGVFYWERTFTFEVDSGGYHPVKILDAGWNELSGGVKKAIRDTVGTPSTRPHLLNGTGGKLAVGAAPVYREFTDVYAEENFEDLGLR